MADDGPNRWGDKRLLETTIPESVVAVIRGRRTIGQFKQGQPPRETIVAAIELATWAPNHRKTEPWRFAWLGTQSQQALIELNAELVAAKKGPEAAAVKARQWSTIPGWLAITCVRSEEPLLAEEDYAACCCAVQNLMLALWSVGIGTKWSTGDVTRHPRYAEIVGFDPTVERSVGLIWYGYPETIPAQSRTPALSFVRERP